LTNVLSGDRICSEMESRDAPDGGVGPISDNGSG